MITGVLMCRSNYVFRGLAGRVVVHSQFRQSFARPEAKIVQREITLARSGDGRRCRLLCMGYRGKEKFGTAKTSPECYVAGSGHLDRNVA